MSETVATRILVEEHRLIERGLDCLKVLVRAARRDGRLEAAPATEALALVREFADRCHHTKEEDRLFLSMERQGLPRDGGPLAVMLDEHESGRGHVRAMADRLERAALGDGDALGAFAKHASALDDLLREHIAKENGVLFPMADELLEGAPAEALLADFRRIESDAGGQRHREWIARVRDLCSLCSLEPLGSGQLPTLAREFL